MAKQGEREKNRLFSNEWWEECKKKDTPSERWEKYKQDILEPYGKLLRDFPEAEINSAPNVKLRGDIGNNSADLTKSEIS
jgi:hypothetical protein